MSEALAPATPTTHVPHLRGRWVSAYQAVWCLLALGSVGLLGWSLLHPMAHPAIVALRTAKSAVVIAVCWTLLRRRPSDPVAALLSLAFLSWSITSSVDFTSTDVLPLFLDRVRFLLFVLALLLFPDGDWRPGWTRTVAASSVAVFLLGAAEIGGLLSTRMFLPLAIACVLMAIAALLSRFRASTSEVTRQQLKWVALGLVMGISLILGARGGAALSASSPVLAELPVLWEGMFQLGIIIVALGFLVSLLRYRLFDAETVISRSAVYASLTIALVATFGGTEAAIQNLGQEYLGMNIGSISGAMAAAVAAVLLNPLHSRITEWAESRFQPDLILLKRAVPDIIARLAPKGSAHQLASSVLPQINAAIHARHSALLLRRRVLGATGTTVSAARNWKKSVGKEFELPSCDRNDPMFPLRLRLNNDPHAPTWLLLGPRPDGTLYGKEDLDAVRSILPALELALGAACARQAIGAAINRRERILRTEINEVRTRLNALERSTGASLARSPSITSFQL